MKQQKRRDPIKVVLVLTVCLAVLAAACMFAGNAIPSDRQTILAQHQDEVEAINAERDQE